MLIKSLLLVCTAAAVVLAQRGIDGIISGAHFSGQDTSDPNSSGTDIYRNPRNHARAAAAITIFSADNTDFRPREKGIIRDSTVYDNYVRRQATFPGYSEITNTQEQLELDGSRSQFREVIEQTFPEEINDPNEMAEALDRLIPQELSKDDSSSKNWLLTLTTIHSSPDDKITLELTEVTVRLSRDQKTGKTVVERQAAKLSIRVFSLLTQVLIVNAESFARALPEVQINDFLEKLSTNGRQNDEEALEAWFHGSEVGATMCDQTVGRQLYRLGF